MDTSSLVPLGGNLSNNLGEYLREQRQHARLSVRQLSALAGVSNPYLSQIERGVRRPSAEILQQIAKGLSISAETLYVQAGLLDPDEASPDSAAATRAAIRTDHALTPRQRQTLLDIYDSFVGSPGAGTNGDELDDSAEADEAGATRTASTTGAAAKGARRPTTKAASNASTKAATRSAGAAPVEPTRRSGRSAKTSAAAKTSVAKAPATTTKATKATPTKSTSTNNTKSTRTTTPRSTS